MRICLIGTLPDEGSSHHRGPERTTIGLAEALDRHGHDVTVLSDEGDESTVGVRAEILPTEPAPGIRTQMAMAKWILRDCDLDEFDVVHSWRPAPGIDVLSLHGIGMAEAVQSEVDGTFSKQFIAGAKIDRYIKMFQSKFSERTYTTAPFNTRRARQFGFNIDGEVPVGIRREFLQDDKDEIDVFYAARWEVRKQNRFVVDETPDEYEVQIAGPTGEYTEGYENVSLGAIPETSLLEKYRKASIFALPSLFEPFGLSAVEAMAAGTPVVCSDRAGLAHYIEQYDAGRVFEQGDGESYRDALSDVMADRERFSTNAKELVESKLTWDEIAAQYEEVYSGVAT